MDHILAIQELVDAKRKSLSTGVAADIMKQCQLAYETMPKLYKLTWTVVTSHAHVVENEQDRTQDYSEVELSHQTQTLILELATHDMGIGMSPIDQVHNGMLYTGWLKCQMPLVCNFELNRNMVIVQSIVPYEPRKRVRGE